jgi:RNA 2',3'-cyclic 3'-phosphodiesterase
MVDQMNLFGFDNPTPGPSSPVVKPTRGPRKRRKLFFALRPDADAAQEIASLGTTLDKRHGIGGQPLRPDRLHITLHVIGEYDETPQAVIDSANQAGDAVVADTFDVVFDRAMTFIGAKAYVLCGGEGVEQVKAFWLNLGIQLANIQAFKKPSFTPHMTLSYSGRTMAEHPIEPVRWTAREFVLINSHVGETYHEVVGRWPLRV